jgi:hypothetical protein
LETTRASIPIHTATQQSQHACPSSSGSGHSYLQPRCNLQNSVGRVETYRTPVRRKFGIYMFTDPWTGEKPWHRVKRLHGTSYYSANTKHSLYAQWQMILERCNQPDRCYFKISIRVEPAWRGCYTLGSGHNSLTNMRSSRTCIMSLAVWDHGPALRRQRLALCPSIELLYGRYCPGNIRWAWISLQAANKWEQVRKKQNRSCT